MARSVTPKQIIDQVVSSSITRFGVDGKAREVKLRFLAHLVLQSLAKFVKNPDTYGRVPSSFDAALKSVIRKGVLTGTRAQQRQRFERLEAILAAYEAHEDLARIEAMRIGPVSLPAYLRRKTAGNFVNATADMRKQKVGSQYLIQRQVALPDVSQTESWRCRDLRAHISAMKCIKRSENSADELYLLTGSMLVDSTGVWERNSSPASEVFSNPGDNQPVPLPSYPYPVHDWTILDPPDSYSVLPLSAVATVTLMEQDNSDKDRIAAAVRAAYGAVNLLATAGGAGPVGIAISLVGILVNLIVALDGDDHLGTRTFRFDDILDDDIEEYVGEVRFFDGQNGPAGEEDDYSYRVLIYNRTTDRECPDIPPFRITGPTHRTIPFVGGATHGGYRLIAPFPLKTDGIHWRAGPSGATVTQQGGRYAPVSFTREGATTISVEAERVDGKIYTASLEVDVEQSDGGFEYSP